MRRLIRWICTADRRSCNLKEDLMNRFLRWTTALVAGVMLSACCVAPWGHGGPRGHGGGYHGR